MKLMRLALCAAVFALIGGIAFSEDMDIRALQAKLAAQEARLNDLQAKMNTKSGGGTADNVVSLRKNAKVTIGGDMNFRMFESWGKTKTSLDPTWNAAGTAITNWSETTNGKSKIQEVRANDFRVADTKLRVKIDVNDYFEAFFRFDLQDRTNENAGMAQEAYIRWKNVCNSGFSMLVGRTNLVFGGGNEAGSNFSGFYGGSGNENAEPGLPNLFVTSNGNPFFANGAGFAPAHIGWDYSRTTQLTPSWENADGTFKAELSYMQNFEFRGNRGRWSHDTDNYRMYKSVNDGFGSGSFRLTWKPIEGLKIVASAINLYNNVDYDNIPTWRGTNGGTNAWPVGTNAGNHTVGSSSDTAVNLHVAYEPCFIPGFKIWAAYIHEWNAGWVNDLDVDTYHAGVSYKFGGKYTVFAIGEYMRHKYGNANFNAIWNKSNAWSGSFGFKGVVGYGVDYELGYRYENYQFKNRGGNKHTEVDTNTVYARLNFNF